MKFNKIWIQKNDKKVEGDKQPDIRLSAITEDGIFVDIGAFWKSKSGKGYSGKLREGAYIELPKENMRPNEVKDLYPEPPKEITGEAEPTVKYPKPETDESIPF